MSDRSDDAPGRICPAAYGTRPEGLAEVDAIPAETAYVIGGLYGNEAALAAIRAQAAQEVATGLPRPRLVFNGDFHWFDAEPGPMAEINQAVLDHPALLGNVEMELIDPRPGAGCGCAYPETVDAGTVARSNRIMEYLQAAGPAAAELAPGDWQRLAGLPRQLRLQVGPTAVGVVHGDPENLSGWGLAVEAMPAPGGASTRIEDWFRGAGVRVLASTHTCLPFAQDFRVDGMRCLVINNGSAGMPNFRDDPRLVITRISRHPAPWSTLYGTVIDGVHCDALGVDWSRDDWLETVFQRIWLPDSPARVSYLDRLERGPGHTLADAARITG